MSDTVARFLDIPRLCRCRWEMRGRRLPRMWARTAKHSRCQWPPHQRQRETSQQPRPEDNSRRAA